MGAAAAVAAARRALREKAPFPGGPVRRGTTQTCADVVRRAMRAVCCMAPQADEPRRVSYMGVNPSPKPGAKEADAPRSLDEVLAEV